MAWVEQLGLRTAKAKHFVDDQTGQRRAVLGVHDQHYWDGAQWQDVVEDYEDDGTEGFAHRVSRAKHQLRVATDGSRRWYPRREHQDEYVVLGRPEAWNGASWVTLPLLTPTRSSNRLTWDRPTHALTLDFTWHRVKVELTLKTSAAARRVRWPISLVGLTWDQWKIRGQDGSVVATVDDPTASDANGAPLPITHDYSGGYVTFTGDPTAFANAAYPVTIDPTFTSPQTSADACTNIQSGSPTSNFDGNGWLECMENYFGNYRIPLLKFDLSSLSGATVNSASLRLTVASEQGETNWTVYANQLLAANAGWTEAGATYNTIDGATAWAGSAGARTSGTDYSTTDDGSVGITTPASSNGANHTITLTPSRVAAAIANNYGWRLRITSGKGEIFSSDDHPTAAYRPLLTIDYTTGGGTTYTATLSGTLTSSGALVKQARKVLAGTVASAGALVRQSRKLLAGGLTPSGAVAKQIARPGLAGSVTPTGALSKQPRLASLAGTLTSAGTLARQLGKGLSGTLTGSGALAKQVSKTFAGTLSSSGAIGVVKVLLISLGGALGSGGALGVRVGKTLGGTVSSSGTLSKQLGKTFAGSLTSSGAIVATKVALVAVGGTLAAGGTLALQVGKQLAGTLAPSGGLAKQLGLALGGTLRPAGSLLAGVNVVLRNLVWTIGRPLAKWAARSPLATWRASSPRD